MNRYEVCNNISGRSLGLYFADAPDGAIAAMVAEAGGTGEGWSASELVAVPAPVPCGIEAGCTVVYWHDGREWEAEVDALRAEDMLLVRTISDSGDYSDSHWLPIADVLRIAAPPEVAW